MAEGTTLTKEIATIKIYICIGGVFLLSCGLMLNGCCLAVFILNDQINLFGLPLFTIGFIVGGFVCGVWAIFSGISFVSLGYTDKEQNGKHLCIRMIEFKIRWSLFFMLMLVAGVVILGIALRTSVDIDRTLLFVTIAVIIGCGICLIVTFLGSIYLAYRTEKFGLKLTPPSKESLITVFKTHGCVITVICLHQVVWGLVGLIMPEFAVTEEPVRIVAFIIGGFVAPLMGLLTAALCFRIVRNVASTNQYSRVMTSTMVKVHKIWVWLFLVFDIAGTGLYIASISISIDSKKENGEWTLQSPLYMVANYVFPLLGNVLLGYLFLAVAYYEKFENVLGFHSKPTPA